VHASWSRGRSEKGERCLCALQFCCRGGEREEDRRRGEICGWFRENSKRICLTLCGVLESYIAPIRSKPLNVAALRSAERINSVEFSFEILATRLTDVHSSRPSSLNRVSESSVTTRRSWSQRRLGVSIVDVVTSETHNILECWNGENCPLDSMRDSIDEICS